MRITKAILLEIGFKPDGLDLSKRQIYSLSRSHHPKISLIEDVDFWNLFVNYTTNSEQYRTFEELLFNLYNWGYQDGKDDKRKEIWKALGLRESIMIKAN